MKIEAETREGDPRVFILTETGEPYAADANGYESGGIHTTVNGVYLANFRDMDAFKMYLRHMRYLIAR